VLEVRVGEDAGVEGALGRARPERRHLALQPSHGDPGVVLERERHHLVERERDGLARDPDPRRQVHRRRRALRLRGGDAGEAERQDERGSRAAGQRLARAPGAGPRRSTLPEPQLAEVGEDRVEHRDGQQREQETQRLPAGDQHADGPIGGRSRTAAEEQRRHAGHERDGRHQNRPQPRTVRLDDGVAQRQPAPAQLVGVVHLQNGVLLYDAEQQQQRQDGEDVEALAGDERREQPERNRQRQREHDRHRMHERLELRRQHHVHEDQRERDGQRERRPGLL
jgi:hypothetical protein